MGRTINCSLLAHFTACGRGTLLATYYGNICQASVNFSAQRQLKVKLF